MNILYLGTGALDAIPSPFCNCEVCKKSLAAGGRNIRTRSQALIDGELLLDLGPDTYSHFFTFGVASNKITDCLITHSHCDHLYPDDLTVPMYSTSPHFVTYHTGRSGYDKILSTLNEANRNTVEKGIIGLELVLPYKEFTAGNYRILPVPANHSAKTSPFMYAIERDGKRMLYAHDTGIFFKEAINALKKFGRLDFISLDCTGAVVNELWKNEHMTLLSVRMLVKTLKNYGIADSRTVIALSHISHIGGATYDELVKSANDFVVAYDGLSIEI